MDDPARYLVVLAIIAAVGILVGTRIFVMFRR
jgi:hypothetical protein